MKEMKEMKEMKKNKKKKKMRQIQIELKKNDDSILTPWQIQDFISILASNYYKLDLINEISKKINEGTSEENIFIINESFNYKISYNFLKKSNILDLKTEEGFKHFFHLGNPISLIPNTKINDLSLKFSLFRELNTYLFKKGQPRIDKDKFHEVVFKNNSDIFNEIIKLIKLEKNTDIDLKKRIKNDINDIKKKYIKLLNKRKYDEIRISSFKKLIKENKLDDKKEYEDIEEKYFNTFENYFIKLERPIVGIYKVDKQEVEILSSSFIMKDSRDERFLDIKQISHNSPTYVNIFIGTVIATPLLIMLGNIIVDKVKKCTENENNGFIQENNSEDILCEKLSGLENKYKKQKKLLNKLIEIENLNSHEKIENEYSKDRITSMADKIETKTVENIKSYGFENENLKSKIINFKDIHKKN
ncbi:hypothetical protein [Clostridium perfringens]